MRIAQYSPGASAVPARLADDSPGGDDGEASDSGSSTGSGGGGGGASGGGGGDGGGGGGGGGGARTASIYAPYASATALPFAPPRRDGGAAPVEAAPAKRLRWSDQAGGALFVVHYSANLHYSVQEDDEYDEERRAGGCGCVVA